MIKTSLLLLAIFTLLSSISAKATNYDEVMQGDLSNERLNPNSIVLSYGQVGINGVAGNNIISGKIGRSNGVIDRDYLHMVVPSGFVWPELRLGNQTNVGGGASFVGLASGNIMPIGPSSTSAMGLLGYKLYGMSDLQKNILDDMGISANGSTGFTLPFAAGDYTLWMQELATGNYNCRLNLMLSPVTEPQTHVMLLASLSFMSLSLRQTKRR